MCGIAGIFDLSYGYLQRLERSLNVMNELQAHRGPDDSGIWLHERGQIGFAHRRLSIIDLVSGKQPMMDKFGNVICFNGEIYNYIELKQELSHYSFSTTSDTEVILAAYCEWGDDFVNRLRGMFSFAIWDESKKRLFCARDRFGIKPFYYIVHQGVFYFASEVKALLPFLPEIETDLDGFKDYLAFQFCLKSKTLFKGVQELPPAHTLSSSGGSIAINRYWEIYYRIDFHHTDLYFEEKLDQLLKDSVAYHLRGDVPVGAYISGGLDSGAIAAIAGQIQNNGRMIGFNGKFSQFGPQYDESRYARSLAENSNFQLEVVDMSSVDFVSNIRKVIYHLDYPIAGPGSFPQYMVSQLAAKHRKVVLGGQGGDEIFGGYTRYLIAYFEQCIKGAIDGTMNNGNFVVTYESIIPNLTALQNYKPLLKEFWKDGLFESMDRRYFRLINRASDLSGEVNLELLGEYSSFESFKEIFNGDNVKKESYFDMMTNFDFKTLLPALLQVEDRVSMAHGLESRVPLLDHPLVELAATIPADVKFKNGSMKHVFKQVMKPHLPKEIFDRKDKMGFPTPLTQWIKGEARDFIYDLFNSTAARNRVLINNRRVLENLDNEEAFSRKLWGFLCLELWQQEFHDRGSYYKKLIGG